jgi:hypothetical protein
VDVQRSESAKNNSNNAVEMSKVFFVRFVVAVGHHSVIKVEEGRDAIPRLA